MKPIALLMMSVIASISCREPSPSVKEAGGSNPPADSVTKAVDVKTAYAEVNGRKIAYRSIGKGLPIILCQRFRGNLDSWDPLFLDELGRNYRVLIFDYSGFGLSTGKPPVTMIEFANDVRDLATSLGLQKIIVGGWSFGGAVAQIVTSEYPELVSQTILIGTRPPGPFKHEAEKIFLETSAKPENDLADEIILFFEPSSEHSKKLAKESHDRIAQRSNDKDVYIKQELWKHYVMGFEDYAKDPYGARKKLAETTIPMLVISADHEVVFPPQNWFEVNRIFLSTQLLIIPHTGHGPQQQYPVMVADNIHSFIGNNIREGLVK